MKQEVNLKQVLQAREQRVRLQQELCERHKVPIISFTMNIAGPVKDSPLLRRAFFTGIRELESGFIASRLTVLEKRQRLAVTGCEAVYAVRATALQLKRLCVSIEECSSLGRLFDMDVLTVDGDKLDRQQVGGQERGCIVCGAFGRGCASRRIHDVKELQEATRRIIERHFAEADSEATARLVTKALLDEVCTTPKPGLVDRANNGSHSDMDIFTFTASAAALHPYWARCTVIGMNTAELPPGETFKALRNAGQQAERTMFSATNGVNTHKGAIFTLGLLCGAVGRLWRAHAPCQSAGEILKECAAMATKAVEADFAAISNQNGLNAATAGERLYITQGLTGVRGEAALGFPSVAQIALPALKNAVKAGKSRNDAGAVALLRLMASVADTNMLARGGAQLANEAAIRCAGLLECATMPDMVQLEQLDRWFVQKNLSAGGCADLLSAAFFLMDLENSEELTGALSYQQV